MELSVMIAAHKDEEGLYLTTFAAIQQLEKTDLDWEIVISADAGTPAKWEKAHKNVRVLRLTGGNRTGSPQGTRDAGIRAAQYKNVMCLDSHVIVSDMTRWAELHEKIGATISFPAMIGTGDEMFKIYGNQMDFDNCFWNVQTYPEPASWEPFKVCQCAHSGFMVGRNFYLESGGYTLEQKGYGGEEPWLSLLAWMMGKTVWFIPEVSHAHYMPQGRNDGAGQTEDFARNFMLCSYVMGGQEYLEKTQKFFSWAKPLVKTPEIIRRREMVCAGPFKGDLNLLREHFKKTNVVGGCN